MELTQLRYFQVAAYYQHISHAAEELNISQPALSTMITRLEKELGVPLFDHFGRTVVLNQNGQLFLKHVNNILSELNDSKRELHDSLNNAEQTISIAVSSSQFLQGMHVFMYRYPNYKWNQRVATNAEIAKLLKQGKIDLALVSPGIYDEEFDSQVLLKDVFKLAVHKDNPLAKHKSVKLRDLTNEPFIMLLKGQPFRDQTDQLFATLGIKPRYIMECDHLLRRELVNSNAGITIASHSASFRHLYNQNIRFLDIEDIDYSRDIVLVSKKKRYKNTATKQFEEFLRQKFSPNSDANENI
jgi:LysR family transcriptional activator of glutamate synthase operon